MKRTSGFTRREFVKRTAIAGAGLALPWQLARNEALAAKGGPPPPPPALQTPIDPKLIPKFVQPLPTLGEMDVVDGTTGAEIPVQMLEFQAEILPPGTAVATPPPAGQAPKTWAWGYFAPGSARKSYIGPVVIAQRGTPTQMRFINNLGNAETSNVLAYSKSVDLTLMWADPLNNELNSCAQQAAVNPSLPAVGVCAGNYVGPIPACVHIHGGEVPAGLDGGPDAWYTSELTKKPRRGHGYYTHPKVKVASNEAVYRYPNTQEAAPVWFHDHTLGATRLNVYAGLAGAYYLVDPANDPKNLPPLEALVIQDRMFDTNGQLYFPAGVPFTPNPDHPFWVPEFEGDVICVNGKAWPFMNVEPKRYQFLMINGSNARTYEMFLTSATGAAGPVIWQIGTDGGYLDTPVKIDPAAVAPAPARLILMPGERATIIIDFANLPAGTLLTLKNVAKHPYPNGVAAKGATTGQIMQFKVVASKSADTSYNPATGACLRAQPIVRLVEPVTGAPKVTPVLSRQLTLNEVMGPPVTVNGIAYPGGPLEVVVNNTKYNGYSYDPVTKLPMARPDFVEVVHNGNTSYYSEVPTEGTVELWEIINLTADAHPMHLHLVQFQLLNRQAFDFPGYFAAYSLAYGGVVKEAWGPPYDYTMPNLDGALGGNPPVTPFLKGAIMPPAPNEAGWKDTIRVMPGQVTRFLVRWAPTDVPAGEVGYYPFKPCTNNQPHGYVWHCHIVDHEDNEMMRPFFVAENPTPAPVRIFVPGTDY